MSTQEVLMGMLAVFEIVGNASSTLRDSGLANIAQCLKTGVVDTPAAVFALLQTTFESLGSAMKRFQVFTARVLKMEHFTRAFDFVYMGALVHDTETLRWLRFNGLITAGDRWRVFAVLPVGNSSMVYLTPQNQLRDVLKRLNIRSIGSLADAIRAFDQADLFGMVNWSAILAYLGREKRGYYTDLNGKPVKNGFRGNLLLRATIDDVVFTEGEFDVRKSAATKEITKSGTAEERRFYKAYQCVGEPQGPNAMPECSRTLVLGRELTMPYCVITCIDTQDMDGQTVPAREVANRFLSASQSGIRMLGTTWTVLTDILYKDCSFLLVPASAGMSWGLGHMGIRLLKPKGHKILARMLNVPKGSVTLEIESTEPIVIDGENCGRTIVCTASDGERYVIAVRNPHSTDGKSYSEGESFFSVRLANALSGGKHISEGYGFKLVGVLPGCGVKGIGLVKPDSELYGFDAVLYDSKDTIEHTSMVLLANIGDRFVRPVPAKTNIESLPDGLVTLFSSLANTLFATRQREFEDGTLTKKIWSSQLNYHAVAKKMAADMDAEAINGVQQSQATNWVLVEYLKAGIDPRRFPWLGDALKKLQSKSDLIIDRFRIAIEGSRNLVISVDPSLYLGASIDTSKALLKAGEVYIPGAPVGVTVALTRFPKYHPQDVAFLKTVECPKGMEWMTNPQFAIVNHIDMPKVMNLLGGADVDGDILMAIFRQDIVKTMQRFHKLISPLVPVIKESPLEGLEKPDPAPIAATLEACRERLEQFGVAQTVIGEVTNACMVFLYLCMPMPFTCLGSDYTGKVKVVEGEVFKTRGKKSLGKTKAPNGEFKMDNGFIVVPFAGLKFMRDHLLTCQKHEWDVDTVYRDERGAIDIETLLQSIQDFEETVLSRWDKPGYITQLISHPEAVIDASLAGHLAGPVVEVAREFWDHVVSMGAIPTHLSDIFQRAVEGGNPNGRIVPKRVMEGRLPKEGGRGLDDGHPMAVLPTVICRQFQQIARDKKAAENRFKESQYTGPRRLKGKVVSMLLPKSEEHARMIAERAERIDATFTARMVGEADVYGEVSKGLIRDYTPEAYQRLNEELDVMFRYWDVESEAVPVSTEDQWRIALQLELYKHTGQLHPLTNEDGDTYSYPDKVMKMPAVALRLLAALKEAGMTQDSRLVRFKSKWQHLDMACVPVHVAQHPKTKAGLVFVKDPSLGVPENEHVAVLVDAMPKHGDYTMRYGYVVVRETSPLLAPANGIDFEDAEEEFDGNAIETGLEGLEEPPFEPVDQDQPIDIE